MTFIGKLSKHTKQNPLLINTGEIIPLYRSSSGKYYILYYAYYSRSVMYNKVIKELRLIPLIRASTLFKMHNTVNHAKYLIKTKFTYLTHVLNTNMYM